MTTLKSLVDETTNIKNEIVTCYTNFKKIFTEKGIEVAIGEKMLDLVNKTYMYNFISKHPISGDKYTIYEDSSLYFVHKINSYQLAKTYTYNGLHGTVRLSTKFRNDGGSNSTAYLLIKKVSNSESTNIKTITSTSNNLNTYNVDVDVNTGDIIEVYTKVSDVRYSCSLSTLKILCDYKVYNGG